MQIDVALFAILTWGFQNKYDNKILAISNEFQ
jgi:hypothetical protein